MTSHNDLHPDLQRWLKHATRGLKAHTAAIVHAEIRAHYDDAIADYSAAGMTSLEAHRAALVDLGDESATGSALRATHQSVRRYLIAMLCALAFPFLLFMIPLWVYNVTGSEFLELLLMNALVLLPTIYVLRTFQRLANERTINVTIKRPVTVIIWGLSINAVCSIAALLYFGEAAVTQSIDHNLWQNVSLFQALFDWGALAGIAIAGAGMYLLASSTAKLSGHLYGLGNLLTWLLYADAIVTAGYAVSVMLTSRFISIVSAMLFSSLTFMLHTIIFAVLTLLFFRVIYQPTQRPAQTA